MTGALRTTRQLPDVLMTTQWMIEPSGGFQKVKGISDHFCCSCFDSVVELAD